MLTAIFIRYTLKSIFTFLFRIVLYLTDCSYVPMKNYVDRQLYIDYHIIDSVS